MKQFLFLIDQNYITGATFLKPAFASVHYTVDNGQVKVWDITIPFYLCQYLSLSKMMPDVRAAAQNNAESEGLVPVQCDDIAHVLNAVK